MNNLDKYRNTQKYENKLFVSIEDWEQYIKNWEMPKQNIKEMYKVEALNSKKIIGLKSQKILIQWDMRQKLLNF